MAPKLSNAWSKVVLRCLHSTGRRGRHGRTPLLAITTDPLGPTRPLTRLLHAGRRDNPRAKLQPQLSVCARGVPKEEQAYAVEFAQRMHACKDENGWTIGPPGAEN